MTNAAAFMLEHMHTGGWGNPHWNGDEANGSVMPGEGQLLYGLVRALKPKIVYEIGTAYGYSCIHMAAGCRDNGLGVVHTVESDPERRAQAVSNVTEAGLADWVRLWPTPPAQVGEIELAFLDAGHTAAEVR
jgi:predicted O-methyltransferase YrrM